MKTSKIIFICALLSSSIFSYSQQVSEIDRLFNKVKIFYQTKTFDYQKKSYTKHPIFLNKDLHILQLGSAQIPLNKVEISYDLSTPKDEPELKEYIHTVAFKCIQNEECIKFLTKEGETKNLIGFGAPFKNESECYEFINLISDLKKALNKK